MLLGNDSSAQLNACQAQALEALDSGENVFLTGVAGSGKSFLTRYFLRGKDPKAFPVLASTGAAAILVGGRTFHSFFGLGILEGGEEATVDRALRDKRLLKRLKETEGVIIDEISMLSGLVLRTAERIARSARGNSTAWGGLRVLAVGDFAQLPPVSMTGQKDWAFLDPVWDRSGFLPVVLREIMRTSDPEFLRVLNHVREGVVNPEVVEFLKSRTVEPPSNFEGTRLFGRKVDTERYNLERIARLPSQLQVFPTQYSGKERHIEQLKKNAPIPELLQLKEGALVMLRQNDPVGRWVNGSTGSIVAIDDKRQKLVIQLLNGRVIDLEAATFTLLDEEGNPVASATNFPLTLAYAITIHKAQGATLDKMMVDLMGFWESGQAYVALSRAISPEGLFIEKWSTRSIIVDRRVTEFHRTIRFGTASPSSAQPADIAGL